MAINLDISTDYLIFDNMQVVSLTSPAGVTVSTKKAVKETISESYAIQGQAVITSIKCRWHMFVSQLTTTVPQEHGYITDEDGIKHYIDQGGVSLASWDTRYEILTTAQATAALT